MFCILGYPELNSIEQIIGPIQLARSVNFVSTSFHLYWHGLHSSYYYMLGSYQNKNPVIYGNRPD